MNQNEFLKAVSSLTGYRWRRVGNRLMGKALNGKFTRGQIYNPITALARTRRVGNWPNTINGTHEAAKALGISKGVANSILSTSNRGNSQILRGRLSEVLL